MVQCGLTVRARGEARQGQTLNDPISVNCPEGNADRKQIRGGQGCEGLLPMTACGVIKCSGIR